MTTQTKWTQCDDCQYSGEADGHNSLACEDCNNRFCETLLETTGHEHRCESCAYKYRRAEERSQEDNDRECAAGQRYEAWKDSRTERGW